MKNMKKLASLLLALVMVLGLATTGFAVQEGTLTGGSITITDAVPGQTYHIYQILYLESYHIDNAQTGEGQYAYKANSAWSNFINSKEIKGVYVNVDAQGYVTWVKSASVADFAKLAQAYATERGIEPDGTATAPAADEGQTYSTVSFENLNLGYYLVDTTLGTLCSLDTTNPNVVMEEKNQAPTNEKEVQEDSDSTWGDKNDADIGQTVNFRSTITAQPGAENYVFHDTMSDGLTLDASSIKVYTNEGLTNELPAANYTVTTSGLSDGCTFEVSFKQTYLDTITTPTTLYVTYSATVNEDAVVGDEGNPNESKLSYGDSTNTKFTPGSTTNTYTWELPVFKYTGTEKTPLAGAEFVLYKVTGENKEYAVVEGGKLTRWTTDKTQATKLVSDNNGKIKVEGLDADTYYLEETKAPDGYNKLAGPVTVVIDSNGKINATTDSTNGVTQVEIENKSGTELPSTGGMGTTIFYALGSILVLTAAVLLVTKKRMSAKG